MDYFNNVCLTVMDLLADAMQSTERQKTPPHALKSCNVHLAMDSMCNQKNAVLLIRKTAIPFTSLH